MSFRLPVEAFEEVARGMARKTASVISMRGDGIGEFNHAPTEMDMMNRIVGGSDFQRRSGLMPRGGGPMGPGIKAYIVPGKGARSSPRALEHMVGSMAGMDTRPTFGMSDSDVMMRSGGSNTMLLDSAFGRAHTIRAR